MTLRRPRGETVRFRLGTAEYEIDLNAKNAGKFRTQMAPFLTHARKAARGPGRAGSYGVNPAPQRRPARAKEHAIEVNECGRILASNI